MPKKKVRIAPSILSADFGRLADEVNSVGRAGADWIHIDVMDGRFVPNITIGPLVVSAIRRAAPAAYLDCHLMIVEPEGYISEFARAGANVIGVHVEVCAHLERTLQMIRAAGSRSCVALNPATPEVALKYVLHCVDQVIVMTVNPGFGGQSFMKSVLPKIAAIRSMIDEGGWDIDLEVDGGVTPETSAWVREAGADALVAGSAVFGARDYTQAIRSLRGEP